MGRKAANIVKVVINLGASTHQVLSVQAFNAGKPVDAYILDLLESSAKVAKPLPLFPLANPLVPSKAEVSAVVNEVLGVGKVSA